MQVLRHTLEHLSSNKFVVIPEVRCPVPTLEYLETLKTMHKNTQAILATASVSLRLMWLDQ